VVTPDEGRRTYGNVLAAPDSTQPIPARHPARPLYQALPRTASHGAADSHDHHTAPPADEPVRQDTVIAEPLICPPPAAATSRTELTGGNQRPAGRPPLPAGPLALVCQLPPEVLNLVCRYGTPDHRGWAASPMDIDYKLRSWHGINLSTEQLQAALLTVPGRHHEPSQPTQRRGPGAWSNPGQPDLS
jgi:hypothetical protein